MKLKKITAAALAAALVVTGMSLYGIAETKVEVQLPTEVITLKLGGTETITAGLTAVSSETPSDAMKVVESAANALKLTSGAPEQISVSKVEDSVDVSGTESDSNASGKVDFTVKAEKYVYGETNETTLKPTGVNGVSGTVTVTIDAPTLTVIPETLELTVGDSTTLKAEIGNVDSSVKGVTYQYATKDPDIIQVESGSGKVTAKAVGKATVTAVASYNGTKIAEGTADITVEKPPVTLTFEDKSTEMELTLEKETQSEPIKIISENAGKILTKTDKATIATAEVSEDNTSVTVKAGKETETTDITIYSEEESTTEIVIHVTVKEKNVVVAEGKVNANINDDAVDAPDDASPEAVKTLKRKVENELMNNTAVKDPKLLATGSSSLATVTGKLGDLFPDVTDPMIEVFVKQELKGMQMEADEDGNLYLKKLLFDIKPFAREVNSKDKEPQLIDNDRIKGSFPLIIPVPDSVKYKRAIIRHFYEDGRKVEFNKPIKGEARSYYVVVRIHEFSDFELEFTNEYPPETTSSGGGNATPSNGGGSGSSSSSKNAITGEWVQDANGWWFRNSDGTWPAGQWIELPWNNTSNWYYFNADGYMVSGWFTDTDGNRYFLHNVADGTQGYMYTGWHQIDGKWYYFNPVAGGPMGALLTNTTTPDGYAVGADGAWVQ